MSDCWLLAGFCHAAGVVSSQVEAAVSHPAGTLCWLWLRPTLQAVTAHSGTHQLV